MDRPRLETPLRRGKSRRGKSRFQASQKKSKCMDRPRLRTPLRHGKSRRGKSRFQASQKKVNVWAGRVSRPTETREIETWEIAISGVSKKTKCMDRPRLKSGLETWAAHTFISPRTFFDPLFDPFSPTTECPFGLILGSSKLTCMPLITSRESDKSARYKQLQAITLSAQKFRLR
jgi:hypothetical protein